MRRRSEGTSLRRVGGALRSRSTHARFDRVDASALKRRRRSCFAQTPAARPRDPSPLPEALPLVDAPFSDVTAPPPPPSSSEPPKTKATLAACVPLVLPAPPCDAAADTDEDDGDPLRELNGEADERSRGHSDSEWSTATETEEERRVRWAERWEREGATQPPRPSFERPAGVPSLGLLKIRYWDRAEADKEAKLQHLDALDLGGGANVREEHVLNTTLKDVHVAIEPNMFPYLTPPGVEHYTLWSRTFLELDDVEVFVEVWLHANRPEVTAWAFDTSNLSEGMSVDLWHVHIFLYAPPAPLLAATAIDEAEVEFGPVASHHVFSPPSPQLSPGPGPSVQMFDELRSV